MEKQHFSTIFQSPEYPDFLNALAKVTGGAQLPQSLLADVQLALAVPWPGVGREERASPDRIGSDKGSASDHGLSTEHRSKEQAGWLCSVTDTRASPGCIGSDHSCKEQEEGWLRLVLQCAGMLQELSWEKLHSGPWKEVELVWRDLYMVASILLAMCHRATGYRATGYAVPFCPIDPPSLMHTGNSCGGFHTTDPSLVTFPSAGDSSLAGMEPSMDGRSMAGRTSSREQEPSPLHGIGQDASTHQVGHASPIEEPLRLPKIPSSRHISSQGHRHPSPVKGSLLEESLRLLDLAVMMGGPTFRHLADEEIAVCQGVLEGGGLQGAPVGGARGGAGASISAMLRPITDATAGPPGVVGERMLAGGEMMLAAPATAPMTGHFGTAAVSGGGLAVSGGGAGSKLETGPRDLAWGCLTSDAPAGGSLDDVGASNGQLPQWAESVPVPAWASAAGDMQTGSPRGHGPQEFWGERRKLGSESSGCKRRKTCSSQDQGSKEFGMHGICGGGSGVLGEHGDDFGLNGRQERDLGLDTRHEGGLGSDSGQEGGSAMLYKHQEDSDIHRDPSPWLVSVEDDAALLARLPPGGCPYKSAPTPLGGRVAVPYAGQAEVGARNRTQREDECTGVDMAVPRASEQEEETRGSAQEQTSAGVEVRGLCASPAEEGSRERKPVEEGTVAVCVAVPYASMPSLERFYCDYMAAGVPVVVTDAMNHWPAMARWRDLAYLCRVAGARTVPVEVGETYLSEGWGQQLMTLRRFIETHVLPQGTKLSQGIELHDVQAASEAAGRMASADEAVAPPGGASEGTEGSGSLPDRGVHDGPGRPAGADARSEGKSRRDASHDQAQGAMAQRPRGYLAQHALFEQIPALQRDIFTPDYCTLGDPGELIATNAWFGPGGTVTPLHTDPYHNLLAQVVGAKYVRLYSPSCNASMYPYSETMLCNSSQVNLDVVDEERFPLFKQAPYWDCILKPGEMLYIPPLWWHYVKALSVSFSVSFWWQ